MEELYRYIDERGIQVSCHQLFGNSSLHIRPMIFLDSLNSPLTLPCLKYLWGTSFRWIWKGLNQSQTCSRHNGSDWHQRDWKHELDFGHLLSFHISLIFQFDQNNKPKNSLPVDLEYLFQVVCSLQKFSIKYKLKFYIWHRCRKGIEYLFNNFVLFKFIKLGNF